MSQKNTTAAEGGRRFLWKRSASGVIPGNIKPVTSSSPASKKGGHSKKFSEFQRESADAWDTEDDEMFKFAVLNYPKAGSASGSASNTPKKKSSGGLKGGDAAGAAGSGVDSGAGVLKMGQNKQGTVEEGVGDNSALSEHMSKVSLNSNAKDSGTGAGEKSPVLDRGGSDISLVDDRITQMEPRFKKILDEPNVDLEQLKKLSWSGISKKYRPDAWRFLSGYLPANKERRAAVLQRKRGEYWAYVEQYFETRKQENNKGIFHQIHIDVPRTNPNVSIFQQPTVQRIFERILYVWAIRHPASGYVQGINDLVTPFFLVFLSEFVEGEVLNVDCDTVEKEKLDIVEADSFWCMSKLLDSIQDNYTFAQPGIQRKILALKELVSRIDSPLNMHLQKNDVEYLQFAFRWMNCLLMREVPIECIIRVWDTYLSEGDGFASLHLYVCAAFLARWSKEILQLDDFQSIMLFIQNLDTKDWTNKDIELLLSEAYMWKYKFNDAPNHFS
eukprot:Nk52_evm73s2657 gene=Nk52_evmTU73s2657